MRVEYPCSKSQVEDGIYVQRKLFEKYADAILKIKCVDGIIEKKVSRIVLANISKYFEMLFDRESPDFVNGMIEYNIQIPFSRSSVDCCIEMFYDKFQMTTSDVAIENILTLDYLHIPTPILEYSIANIISQCELMISSHPNHTKQAMNEMYSMLEQFEILPQSVSQSLLKRIEYMTDYKQDSSVEFCQGLTQPDSTHEEFVIMDYFHNFRHKNREYAIGDYIVSVCNDTYMHHLPSTDLTFIGISARLADEPEELSFKNANALIAQKQTPSKKISKLEILVSNGLEDPLVKNMHDLIHSQYKKISEDKDIQFPTNIDPVILQRTKYGIFYPLKKLNIMSFVRIRISFSD
jgi:hypothetical protein